MNRLKIITISVLLILVLAAGVGPLHAQDQEVVLQLAVPGYMEEMFTSGVLDQFEAEHPGVRVELVTTGGSAMMIKLGGSAGQGDIEDVLDEREEYVSSADVLVVSSGDLSPEITRAGYFLDLKALINSDPNLNSADFYTAVWQSFQWDDGFWALPASADPVLLFYDPAAFDAANLPYPDTWRSIADVELAIRTLTELNADGTVASLGFMNMGSGPGLLLLSLLGQTVYDDSVLPSVPNFNSPDLENLLTVWAQMQADGLFNPPQMTGNDEAAKIFNPPLQLVRSAFSGGPEETEQKKPALLPGGRAGLDVSGFAISSGTQYPEAAYELVKFLTNNSQVASGFIGSTPANRNLTAAVPNSESGPMIRGAQSPELAVLIPVALEQAYPASEMRFSEYLSQAIDHMVQDQVDANTALQDMEDKALARLDTASTRRDTTQIVVQTPLPTADLAPGEIALKFGVASMMSPLPNQDQVDALAADFAARDPEVGAVQIKAGLSAKSLSDLATDYDCFFGSGNVVPTADLSLLRSLDPLLATDPTYDPNDMANGVMQQVQRDGQTWGLPVTIQPFAMRYDPELFSQAGAVPPVNGWTAEEFEYALEALKANTGDSAPFIPSSPGNTHLLMLIAAYGGLPLDYRTNPPTINFTDPNTVAAIQRVLDLAKNGYIDYSELASLGGVSFSFGENDTTPLYTDTLSSVGGIGGGGGMMVVASAIGGSDGGDIKPPQDVDLLTTFPQGSTYTAISYGISVAYISANTPYTEACYRFISELSRRTDLIPEMPARHSLINSPELASAQGQDQVSFYQTMDALMQQPNTVIIPSGFDFDPAAMGNTLLSFWLNRAFDRYVNEDADLPNELADAELFTKDYQNCSAAIAPYDPSSDDFRTYYQQFMDCAVQVDPSTADYFAP